MSEKKSSSVVKSERYIIDGKEYHSLSDIPEPERKKLEAHLKLLEDKDKDGMPDIFQREGTKTSHVQTTEFRVSSSGNADDIGARVKSALEALTSRSLGTERQGQENKISEPESRHLKQQQDEQRRERIRNYVLIIALVAAVVFLAFMRF